MNWIDALDKFFKVKDVYDQVAELKKLSDYGKKLEERKSLEWDDLKFFENEQMTAATKKVRNAVKAADEALNAKADWPESGSLAAFASALKAAEKFGHDSVQTKKAVEAYRKCLTDYEKALQGVISNLEMRQQELPRRIRVATALAAYCEALEDAFMKCAQIPNPLGTAQNAEFFSLSQDAQQLRGEVNSLRTRLEKIEKRNAEVIAEGKAKIEENKAWIAWASKDATSGPDSLKKNEKATKPRK